MGNWRSSVGVVLAITVLAVARPSMAEGPNTVNVKTAVLVDSQDNPMNVSGGVWLSDEQALRVAQRLREAGGLPPIEVQQSFQTGWVLPTVIGVGLGLFTGYLIGSL